MDSRQPRSDAIQLSPSDRLMEMINGYLLSQVVHVMAKLNIADHIVAGSETSDELAETTATNPGALYRLLRACASYGLLEETEQGGFAMTPMGELLRSEVPDSVRDYAAAIVAPGHWLPFGRLDTTIATGQSTVNDTLGMGLWEYYSQNEEEGRHFAGAMSDLSALAARDVPANYDVSGFKRIVDVGGSHGALLSALLEHAPKAEGVLFDLPDVIETAKETIDGAAPRDRVQLVGGDFFREIPLQGDLYVLKHILHDWPDEQALTILRGIHAAAAPESTLLIVELLVPDGPDGAEQSSTFLDDLLMLTLFGARERRADEYEALLSKAGYGKRRVIQTDGPYGLIEAVRV